MGIPLLFRSDASEQIGSGHVMRCLALAQAARDAGFEPVFAIASSRALRARIEGEGFPVIGIDATPGSPDDANQTIAAARHSGAGWMVVDGYHFTDVYQKAIVDCGTKLLAVDDYGHASHYWAHLVLNQNFDAHENIYRHREAHTRLLLGPSYVLLRREFTAWHAWKREIAARATRVLVTIGGSDPGNATPKVVEALRKLEARSIEAVVVVGADNPHYQEIVAQAQDAAVSIQVRHNVQSMPEVMAWADLAIIVFGTSLWELYFMGCPTLVFGRGFMTEPILRDMDRKGLVRYLGFEDAVNPTLLAAELQKLRDDAPARQRMATAGRELIDGRGAARVVQAMQEIS